jgi:hypothetical protein
MTNECIQQPCSWLNREIYDADERLNPQPVFSLPAAWGHFLAAMKANKHSCIVNAEDYVP